MANIIEMPKLSDTMTVGTMVKWVKPEGEVVKNGDMLAEVETDKATMELECFFDGTLLKIFTPAGTQVEIGAPLCAVGKPGEKVETPGKPAATVEPSGKAAATVETPGKPAANVGTPGKAAVKVEAPGKPAEKAEGAPGNQGGSRPPAAPVSQVKPSQAGAKSPEAKPPRPAEPKAPAEGRQAAAEIAVSKPQPSDSAPVEDSSPPPVGAPAHPRSEQPPVSGEAARADIGAHSTEAAAPASGERIRVSPLARKLAAEKGIDPSGLTGSGPAGRIVQADILAAEKSGAAAPKAGAAKGARRIAEAPRRRVNPGRGGCTAFDYEGDHSAAPFGIEDPNSSFLRRC